MTEKERTFILDVLHNLKRHSLADFTRALNGTTVTGYTVHVSNELHDEMQSAIRILEADGNVNAFLLPKAKHVYVLDGMIVSANDPQPFEDKTECYPLPADYDMRFALDWALSYKVPGRPFEQDEVLADGTKLIEDATGTTVSLAGEHTMTNLDSTISIRGLDGKARIVNAKLFRVFVSNSVDTDATS
jgi:hypothetical protein